MLIGPARTAGDPQEARGVVLPAPLRSAPGLGHCTEKGPAAILAALDGDVPEGFGELLSALHLAPSLEFGDQDQSGAVTLIQEAITPWLNRGLFVLLVGGEHTVTLGATRALQDLGESFGVVYFDAHADLKSGIGKIRLTHATVARRLAEDGVPVAGIGWRSFDAREYEFWRRNSLIVRTGGQLKENPSLLAELLESLPEKVYLSIDVDVLDPAVMPSTGVPEPDGLSLRELESILGRIFQLRTVIGADLVELSPLRGKPRPDLTAAWLGLKVLGMGLDQSGDIPSSPGVIHSRSSVRNGTEGTSRIRPGGRR